jgi:hypothetical protein
MYRLPSFQVYWWPFGILGTLRDIATFDPSKNYRLNCPAGAFSMDDLAHAEKVVRARGNLERYLRFAQDWDSDEEEFCYENFLNTFVRDDALLRFNPNQMMKT